MKRLLPTHGARASRPRLSGRKALFGCLLWSFSCLGTVPGWAATDEAVAASVDRFHGLLIETMRTEGFDRRAALMEPAVAEFFDLGAVARISVGPNWRGLSEERRSAFVALMHRLVTATYADRFDSYSGQSFVQVETVTASTGPVVKTLLNRASGEPVTLDYYFRGARVFNVVADGVSDLSLRRADYASIIREEGIEGLVIHIEASIAEMGGAGG
ncbi:MAG: hypothetical protein F4X81_02550 [Gammaproteobacteria bacterium]|nr:hypothetical protein [Gammaproteobacteria bacterium]MYE50330.1 hypothetical protein [Gammaproteobacteria bacterium]